MKPLCTITTCLVSCFLTFCLIVPQSVGQPVPEDLTVASGLSATTSRLSSLCTSFNRLNNGIRDSRINGAAARIDLKRLLEEIREEYFRCGGKDYPESAWIFPLEGYDSGSIEGGRRHGYSARGYDFFTGNRHGGHPSYDIFIRDRNQDGRDDRSGRPVNVLSMTGGIVVALEGEWEQGSRLRGGRYLWVYDPANDLLVYYAHNAGLSVELGDIVRPGDLLAVVGRTGMNAARRRSPTHLHLTVLKAQDGRVTPLKVFRSLQRARTKSGHLLAGEEPV